MTNIRVTAWDASDGRRLESFDTSASGRVVANWVFVIGGFYEYAPTESTACKDMAEKILRYASGRNYAGK